MIDSIPQLRELQGKLDAKVQRLRSQLAAVEGEHGEIETAIRVLERLNGASSLPTNQPNENGATILKFLGVGESEAQAPKDIHDRLLAAGHDLNADLVRTQLWRMAKRGLLESENGRYWQPRGSVVSGGGFDELLSAEPPVQPKPHPIFDDDLDGDVPF